MNSHSPSVKVYMMVFGALLILTVITVTISWLHLPRGLGITLGLAIAAFKGSLVGLYFMHLKGENKIIYAVLAGTAFFLFVLFVLPAMDFEALSPLRAPTAQTDSAPAGH